MAGKKKDEQQLNVMIPKQLDKQLKAFAFNSDTKIKAVVASALESYMNNVPKN